LKIAILFNEPRAGAAADEADVLVQVKAVEAALDLGGHEVERVPCGLDLGALVSRLAVAPPDLVFNLTEGLAGHDRLIAVVPSLLDSLAIPYTGSSAEAIFVTTNKLLTKERLAAAGLPTPATPAQWPPRSHGASSPPFVPGRYILKPVWEHGSAGMEDDLVVDARKRGDLERRLAALGESTGRTYFSEAFVDGREINLTMLAGAGVEPGADQATEPIMLPAAEIDFSAFPAGKPRIVGWAAKWDEGSFEYHHTPGRFAFPESDRPLLAELESLARACWDVFGLAGYARVDFRVDGAGRPYILEVNSNPCLSPDAGFAAAVVEAGLAYEAGIARVVSAVPLRRRDLVPAAD